MLYSGCAAVLHSCYSGVTVLHSGATVHYGKYRGMTCIYSVFRPISGA